MEGFEGALHQGEAISLRGDGLGRAHVSERRVSNSLFGEDQDAGSFEGESMVDIIAPIRKSRFFH